MCLKFYEANAAFCSGAIFGVRFEFSASKSLEKIWSHPFPLWSGLLTIVVAKTRNSDASET